MTMPINDIDQLRDQMHHFLALDEVHERLNQLEDAPTGHDHVIGAGDSIQDAWDDGQDHLPVAATYDPRADTYPLTFDYEDRTLSIEGVGPGVTQLGHDGVTNKPILDINAGGPHSYGSAPSIRNLSIVDGAPAIRLKSSPYTGLSNVYVSAAGHGVQLVEGPNTCYGVTMFNTQAWNCGGDGFRLDNDSGPHATQFYGCQAIANKGVGFRLKGYKTAMHGGSSQLNHGHGIDVRSPAVSVKDAYIEGNGRREDFPVEIYGKGAHGLTVADCYLNGMTPRQVWHDFEHVQRGVNIHGSKSVSVRDNVYRNFDDALFAGFETDARLEDNWPVDDSVEVAES